MQVKLKQVNAENSGIVGSLILTEPDFLKHYVAAPVHHNCVALNGWEVITVLTSEKKENAIRIHSVLSRGAFYRKAWVPILHDYLKILFRETNKVVICSSSGLIQHIAEEAGFVFEGEHRREADGIDSMLYYGLLREEFENNGK